MRLCPPLRLGLLLLLLAGGVWADEAEKLYKKGRRAERDGDDVKALLFYTQARTKNPAKRKYVLAAAGVRRRAAQTMAAVGDLQGALALDPSDAYLLEQQAASSATPTDDGLKIADPLLARETRRMRPPVELVPQKKTTSFRLRGTIGSFYTRIAKEFGLEVLVDPDFDGERKARFKLDDCSFTEAILALNDVATAFIIPVTPKIFLVAADTSQKRTELEPTATIALPIPDAATTEHINEVGQALKQTLDIKRLHIDPNRSQLLIRDTVTRVRLAQELYSHLAYPRGEVLIDVVLITVEEANQLNYGITLPTSFPVLNFSTVWWNAPRIPDPAQPLLFFGGGMTVFGIQIADTILTARKLASQGKVMSRFSVRAADGLPAEFLIGERFPTLSARFSPGVITDEIQDAIDDGSLREPIPSVVYEDLGIVFRATPRIHSARDISMEMEAEFKQLSGRSVNDLPVFANRRIQSNVRLYRGEAALITGLATVEEQRSHSGLAFLSKIPWLGRLLRSNARQTQRSRLILMVSPRLVRLPPAEMSPTLTLRFGPENRPLPPI